MNDSHARCAFALAHGGRMKPHESCTYAKSPPRNATKEASRLGRWLNESCLNGAVNSGSVTWHANQSWFTERIRSNFRQEPGTDGRSAQGSKHVVVHRGCCPVCQVLYAERPSFRCCTHNKLTSILPLQPIGGLTWPEAAAVIPSNALLVLDGDSMVGQQLVGLLCAAWATPGFRYANLKSAVPSSTWKKCPRWSGTNLHNSTEPCESDPIGGATIGEVVTEGCDDVDEDGHSKEINKSTAACWRMTLMQWNVFNCWYDPKGERIYEPRVLSRRPPRAAARAHGQTELTFLTGLARIEWLAQAASQGDAGAVLEQASVLFIGGWQHQLCSYDALRSLMRKLDGWSSIMAPKTWSAGASSAADRSLLRANHPSVRGGVAEHGALPVVFAEASPSHFPGGSYLGTLKYPRAEPEADSVCDQWTSRAPSFTPSSPADGRTYGAARNATLPGQWHRGISTAWRLRFNQWLEADIHDHNEHHKGLHTSHSAGAKSASTLPTRWQPQFHVLRLERLYAGRGDAHVEQAGESHAPARDCLHFCVAPGVLDALALETLWSAAGAMGVITPSQIDAATGAARRRHAAGCALD